MNWARMTSSSYREPAAIHAFFRSRSVVAEAFTGMKGKYVHVKYTIKGF
jgi:F0F1-type ATP synthase beta subunit